MNFEWDLAKNEEVQRDHDISFEEVVSLIGRGYLIKTMSNPSPKHKGQKIFLVRRGKAVYMVPFEKREGKYRLITAFFSQFFTDKYSR
jgi:uncharacterized DUF497 family protein